ncbi:hypothetical protein BC826DRAFT_974046 [Russula brevipes]|nr:hypothetical protein BC826DRAFT_974046 [Russula brevipes]
MDISANVSSCILSAIFLACLGVLLVHFLLLRRRRRAKPAGRRRSSCRRTRTRSQTRSDSDSEDADGDGDGGGDLASEEKGSRASLNLEPNRPIFVDVESSDCGPPAGLQFLLTPPTPAR